MTTTPPLAPALTPASVLRDALAPFGSPGSLGRDALLDAVSVLGEVRAVLEAVEVRIAGELENRSRVLGVENPVTRAGHTTAAGVLAERWQISIGTARRYCSVGEATGSGLSLTGGTLPPRFPTLAAATAAPAEHGSPNDAGGGGTAGWVSVEQAAVIVRELGKAADRCPLEDLHDGERVLVEHAPSLTVPELRSLAGQVRDRLDQDGIEPREARQRRRRSLTITTTADGMTRIDWLLDPESAGYVVSAVDAVVTADLRRVRFRDNMTSAAEAPEGTGLWRDAAATDDAAGPGSDADADAGAETRTLAQLRSDAAVEVFRHVAGCDRTAVDGVPPVTVMVRIGLNELRTGIGTAEIDGVTAPVSAGTVRRMAADAGIIPVVLGGDSEVLDLGRARRLFSRAQRLALAERDGGCAWPGCPNPPSYTEAHHIRWWNAHGGSTDLDNGILLCSSHHHRVHDDGWQINVRDQVPYFTPPGHVDPHRRPRPGGRIQLRVAA